MSSFGGLSAVPLFRASLGWHLITLQFQVCFSSLFCVGKLWTKNVLYSYICCGRSVYLSRGRILLSSHPKLSICSTTHTLMCLGDWSRHGLVKDSDVNCSCNDAECSCGWWELGLEVDLEDGWDAITLYNTVAPPSWALEIHHSCHLCLSLILVLLFLHGKYL